MIECILTGGAFFEARLVRSRVAARFSLTPTPGVRVAPLIKEATNSSLFGCAGRL